ncbi:MAG: DUF4097 family beta strand repeat-containing protein [Planctomycetota bacterium]|jgi:hypothetical protein
MTETRHSSRIPLLVFLPVVAILIVWLLPGTHFRFQEQRKGELPLPATVKRIKLRLDKGDVLVVGGETGHVRFLARTLRVAQDEEAFRRLRAQDLTLQGELVDGSGEFVLFTPPFPAGLEADYKVAEKDGRETVRKGFRGMRQFDVRVEVPAHLPVDVECRLGNVTVERLDSSVAVRTGGGNVRLKAVAANANVRTEHGDVVVDQHRAGLDIWTRSGRVLVLMADVLKPVKLRTLAGDVKCTVPKRAAFDLDARSLRSGGIISDLNLPRFPLGKEGRGMQGQVNGGGPLLDAESGKGMVSVLVQR